MSTHPLLTAFRANKPAFGAWLSAPGIFHARTVAQASPHISWIIIDCEHGLIPLVPGAAESVTAIRGAIQGGGPSAIVRIPATGVSSSTSWQIKYALDAGASGILVPLVSTVEKAKEIVADCRFPPVGRRGFGSFYTHTIWDVSAKDYLASANEAVTVIVQIENKDAIESVEKIAAVEGIDALFVGPYDLSISLGYPTPNPDPHPDVEKVIQRILQAARGAGKKCGIYCSNGKQGAKRAAEGFDMINITSDVGAMTEAIAGHFMTAIQ